MPRLSNQALVLLSLLALGQCQAAVQEDIRNLFDETGFFQREAIQHSVVPSEKKGDSALPADYTGDVPPRSPPKKKGLEFPKKAIPSKYKPHEPRPHVAYKPDPIPLEGGIPGPVGVFNNVTASEAVDALCEYNHTITESESARQMVDKCNSDDLKATQKYKDCSLAADERFRSSMQGTREDARALYAVLTDRVEAELSCENALIEDSETACKGTRVLVPKPLGPATNEILAEEDKTKNCINSAKSRLAAVRRIAAEHDATGGFNRTSACQDFKIAARCVEHVCLVSKEGKETFKVGDNYIKNINPLLKTLPDVPPVSDTCLHYLHKEAKANIDSLGTVSKVSCGLMSNIREAARDGGLNCEIEVPDFLKTVAEKRAEKAKKFTEHPR